MSDPPPPPTPAVDATASHPPPGSGLPDAGEPQSSRDGRPAMLGKRFRATLVAGSSIGVVLALATHYLITRTIEDSTKFNSWSWVLAVIGGFAVGGACSLFIYGAATDRSDTDTFTVPGRADVSEDGEWRRTLQRRRRRGRRAGDQSSAAHQSTAVDPSDGGVPGSEP